MQFLFPSTCIYQALFALAEQGLGGAKETRVMPYEEPSSICRLTWEFQMLCFGGPVRRINDSSVEVGFFFVGDMVVHAG